MKIRVAWMPNGNIEACELNWSARPVLRVEIEPRSGNVVDTNVAEGSQTFRFLVKMARVMWRETR